MLFGFIEINLYQHLKLCNFRAPNLCVNMVYICVRFQKVNFMGTTSLKYPKIKKIAGAAAQASRSTRWVSRSWSHAIPQAGPARPAAHTACAAEAATRRAVRSAQTIQKT